MAPPPRSRLIELTRQFILYTNRKHMGDVLGMVAPTACMYGVAGVDKFNVSMALFWEDHPGLMYTIPEDDDSIETRGACEDDVAAGFKWAPGRDAVVVFPFTRHWEVGGAPQEAGGIETLVFDERGTIIEAFATYPEDA